MSETNISRKIIRNTAYNAAGRFWAIGISLLLTPYIIHRIGLERYGIWAIASVITGYFGLLDFGVSSSFVRFISEYHSRKQHERLNAVVNTGFVFYFLFSAVVIAASFFSIDPLFGLFKIQSKLYLETAFAFMVAILLFGVNNSFAVFTAVQGGLQRMDISNKVSIVMSILNAGGTVFFIRNGYGLPGLMVNSALVILATSAVNVIVAFRLLPALEFHPLRLATMETFRRLFLFGFRMQLAKFSGLVTGNADKIIIGSFLSIALVSFYHVAGAVIQSVLMITGLLVSALTPAFTEVEAKGERGTLITAYLRGTKYLALVAVPSFAFLVAAASDVMGLWFGQAYPLSAAVIRILSMGFLINLLAQVGASACIAIEKPEFMATGSLIIITLNVVLGVAFAKLFGFPAMAWGTSLALSLGTLYFIFELNTALAVRRSAFFMAIVPFFLASAAAALPVLGLDLAARRCHIYVFERSVLFSLILVKGAVFTAGYAAAVCVFRLIDAEDAAFLRPRLPMLSFLFGKTGPGGSAPDSFGGTPR